MKMLHLKKNSYKALDLSIVVLILFLLSIRPPGIWAKDVSGGNTASQELDRQKSKKDRSIAWYKKLRIELYGGFTTLNPSDLNLLVDYDTGIQEFSYDTYLEYLASNNLIRSWTKNNNEDRKKLKNAFPLGIRLKYDLDSSIAVSLGFKYFSRKQESELQYQYVRNEVSGDQYTETMIYSPYMLSAEAYTPLLGLHITKKYKRLLLEAFLSGGPLFVECHYLSDWHYEWKIKESVYEYIAFSSIGILEEKGTGTGIALELGGRLNFPLYHFLGVFLEGGYAYQVVKNISGSGKEIREGDWEEWNGRWGIKSEKIVTPWGELETELPTNYWPDDSNEDKIRNFKLDLSGFQLRVGLSFRF